MDLPWLRQDEDTIRDVLRKAVSIVAEMRKAFAGVL